MSNSYELVMVFSVAKGDEAVSALVEKFKTMVAESAVLESVDEWGKRRLAYPINDETEGYYVLVNFSGEAEVPAELSRVLNITDGVLRSLVIKKDPRVVAKAAKAAEEKAAQPAAEEKKEEVAE